MNGPRIPVVDSLEQPTSQADLCQRFTNAVRRWDFNSGSTSLWEEILCDCAHFVGAHRATLSLHSDAGIHEYRSQPPSSGSTVSIDNGLAIIARLPSVGIALKTGVLCFQFEADNHQYNVEAQQRVNLLLEQLLDILEEQRVNEAFFAGLSQIIDRMGIRVCLLNKDRTPVVINETAKSAIANHSLLSFDANQQLSCDCMITQLTLEQAVADACDSQHADFKTRRLVVVHDADADITPILLEIEPLKTSSTSVNTLAMITFIVPTIDLSLAVERLSLMFGLTRAESEVLSSLATGATNRQIAARRHVSNETIRSQVTSLLSKLKISRRNELIPLLAANSLESQMNLRQVR